MSDLTTRQWEKTQFTKCYAWGHSWDEYTGSDWRPTFGTPEVVRCERCGTERRRAVDSRGDLIPGATHYEYPEGYKYDKGARPTKADFRLMVLARTPVRKRRAS